MHATHEGNFGFVVLALWDRWASHTGLRSWFSWSRLDTNSGGWLLLL